MRRVISNGDNAMTRGRKGERRQKGARKEIRKDLEQLLQKVEAAPEGTPELDREFAEIFSKAPPDVSTSIDAVVRLIENELPGWWWTFGYCIFSNDASLYVPGANAFPCSNGSGFSIGTEGSSAA
jgi:hypothetical protein